MKNGEKWLLKTACITFFCLILVGCRQTESTKVPSPIRSVQTLQFEVNTALEQEFIEQAELFAKDVERISGGYLMISVVKKRQNSLPEAEYDLAYLQCPDMALLEPSLKTFSMPFLYNNSSHLSLALNSPEINKFVENSLDGQIYPLAVLSSSSALLVTVQAPDEKSQNNEKLMPLYFQGLTLAMHAGEEETAMAFQALGSYVLSLTQEQALTGQLGQTVTVEGDMVFIIDGVEATMEEILKMPLSTEPIYILETQHDLSPVWLTAKEDTWNTLSEWERAVIQEAAAGMIAGFEDSRSRYRAAWEKEVGKRNIQLIQPERQALAATVYDSGSGSTYFPLPAYFDKKLFDLVQNYR